MAHQGFAQAAVPENPRLSSVHTAPRQARPIQVDAQALHGRHLPVSFKSHPAHYKVYHISRDEAHREKDQDGQYKQGGDYQ